MVAGQSYAALATVGWMTVGYAVLGVLTCAGFFVGLVVPCGKQVAGAAGGKNTKSISKMEQITVMFVLVTIGVFMMWVLWLTAWLHQWHPLMMPIKE